MLFSTKPTYNRVHTYVSQFIATLSLSAFYTFLSFHLSHFAVNNNPFPSMTSGLPLEISTSSVSTRSSTPMEMTPSWCRRASPRCKASICYPQGMCSTQHRPMSGFNMETACGWVSSTKLPPAWHSHSGMLYAPDTALLEQWDHYVPWFCKTWYKNSEFAHQYQPLGCCLDVAVFLAI